MGIVHLLVELLFDLLAFILGIILIVRAKDNYQRLYFGIIAAAIGAMMTWENIGWLLIVTDSPSYRFNTLLCLEKMLKWYALAGIVSLFPIASLRPGYLNRFRVLLFLLPSIVAITIGGCYLAFNGTVTPIHHLSQIVPNLDRTDVQLRIAIFGLSILSPLLFFIYPMVGTTSYRRLNKKMVLFLGFMVLFVGIYTIFTLCINEFVFNLFGITAILFTVLFSILYLRSENPFSDHIQMIENRTTEENPISPSHSQPLPLFSVIETTLMEQHPFTDKDFCIETLSVILNEEESDISNAIKSGGFTGFREYVNHLRLDYFKQLAAQPQVKSVKELMYACGFTSRSTFYRLFSEKYGINPSKYLEENR